MKYFRYLSIGIAVIFFSCAEKPRSTGDHPVLKIELTEQTVSVFDIFDKVEIIPLETSEESFH
jgi:hypothetical protein